MRATKLTPEKVAAMRADARPVRLVAAEYGVSRTMVYRILAGLSWKVGPLRPVRRPKAKNNAKINAAIAEQIRQDARTSIQVGRHYSLDPSVVRRIRRGELWRGVAR